MIGKTHRTTTEREKRKVNQRGQHKTKGGKR